MKIACTIAPGRGDTDLLLHAFAQSLIAEGHIPRGTVQINSGEECEGPCDMDVQVLPDGPVIRISQSLGPEARGCRLDPAALETAVGLVETALQDGADCLIVNKFGKHEADGRGFRNAIADALARDIPVIVGLNRLNQQPFYDFAGDAVRELPPTVEALKAWFDEASSEG